MTRRIKIPDKDLYFIEECSCVPASYQQLHNNKPFVHDSPNDDPPVVAVEEEEEDSYAFVDETLNDDPPPTSTPTAMTETQDVFHTPPSEEIPVDVNVYQCMLNEASSFDVDTEFIDLDGWSEKSSYPIDVDVYQCTLNEASFDDDTEFIDLNGFSENMDPKLVPSYSRVVVGDDGVGVLERPKEDNIKRAKFVQEVASAADVNVIGESSKMSKENIAIGQGSRMPKEDNINSHSLFDILKALADDSSDDDDDDDDDHDGGDSLLEAVKAAGMTFPRPRWWPDHFDSTIFNMEKPQRKRKL